MLLNAVDGLYPLPSHGLSYTPASELTAQMRKAPAASDYGVEIAVAKYLGNICSQADYTYNPT